MNRRKAGLDKTINRVKRLLKGLKVPQSVAAKGLGLNSHFFANAKKLNLKSEGKTLKSLDRLEMVLVCAKENLGTKGGTWLLKMNPYLSKRTPISHIGTEEGGIRVRNLLESIGLGLPA